MPEVQRDRYLLLCMQAKQLMQLPPRPATVDAMLGQAFQLAGGSSSAEEDALFGNIRVHLDAERREADELLPDSAAPAPQVRQSLPMQSCSQAFQQAHDDKASICIHLGIFADSAGAAAEDHNGCVLAGDDRQWR